MSLRSCALLALVCLVCPAQTIGVERFPLSGGVLNGVTVTIKAAKVNGELGPSKILFKNPDGVNLFEFIVDTDEKKVRRNAVWGDNRGVDQTWGGWNLEVNESISFEFAKTAKTWAISVNGVRQPWFDFVHPVGLVTHVELDDTFELAEVIQSRPECRTACHASWCSMMPSPTAPTFYSMNSNKCSESQVTGIGNPLPDTWCCDGLPKPINLEDGGVKANDWIQLHDDVTYLDKACQAFGFETCGGMQGQKGRVVTGDQVNGSMEIFNPSLVSAPVSTGSSFDTIPASAIVKIPLLVMMRSPGAQRKLLRLPEAPPRANGRIDDFTGLVYWLNSDGESLGLKKGWFIDMIGMVFNKTSGNLRWFPWGASSKAHLSVLPPSFTNVSFVASDEWLEHETDPCTDHENWQDVNKNTCAEYREQAFCTFHGQGTSKLCANHSLPTPCELYEVSGSRFSAAYECCSCGGGKRNPPAEWSGEADYRLTV